MDEIEAIVDTVIEEAVTILLLPAYVASLAGWAAWMVAHNAWDVLRDTVRL